MRFSEKVRDIRKKLGYSQRELSERVGVSLRSVCSYEAGSVTPRGAILRKLAEALGVTVEYLLNDEATNPNEGRANEERVEKVREVFGGRGAREMAELLQRNTALFAGGDLDQDAKDAFFDALMVAYVTCKEEAKRRYGHPRKTDGE